MIVNGCEFAMEKICSVIDSILTDFVNCGGIMYEGRENAYESYSNCITYTIENNQIWLHELVHSISKITANWECKYYLNYCEEEIITESVVMQFLPLINVNCNFDYSKKYIDFFMNSGKSINLSNIQDQINLRLSYLNKFIRGN